MEKKELAKRYMLFVLGMFFMGLGVGFAKHAGLGVSPLSSVANVLSIKYDFMSIGLWLIIWNAFLVLLQILILRRRFKIYQLLQIPLSVVFGFFTDAGLFLAGRFPLDSYPYQLMSVVLGVVLLAFGVSLTVIANVIMVSGEALVKVLSDKTGLNFGYMKIIFDVACVVASVVLSLVFFEGQIIGTREGTVIAAIFTGILVKGFIGMLKDELEAILKR